MDYLSKDSFFLIAVKSFSGEGKDLLKKLFAALLENSGILESSSIYRVKRSFNHSSNVHDLKSVESFDGLVAVFKGHTELSATQLFDLLMNLEKNFKSEVLHRSIKINLLAFGDATLMTPRLTLPHPNFHTCPEELVLAAQLWSDFSHPILGISLGQLAYRFAGVEWGEFYAQGNEVKN